MPPHPWKGTLAGFLPVKVSVIGNANRGGPHARRTHTSKKDLRFASPFCWWMGVDAAIPLKGNPGGIFARQGGPS